MDVPVLDGIHHIKIPVTDLDRSRAWYGSRLGYQLEIEFVEQGTLMGDRSGASCWWPQYRASPGP